MYPSQLPIPRAYNALLFEASRNAYSDTRARQLALAWLAAARMVTLGRVPGIQSLNELNAPNSWQMLQAKGLPSEDVMLMFNDIKSGGSAQAERAIEIVKTLQNDLGQGPWDVLPTLTSGGRNGLNSLDGGMRSDVIASVAELMLDLVGAVDNEPLWVPFDTSGVLTIRSLRRGWAVNAASMAESDSNIALKLLLAIEYGNPNHPKVHTEISRDAEGRPITRASHLLAIPPFGMQVKNTRLAQWDSLNGKVIDQFYRSESMAVYELLHRVTGRAVFLVPAGILFTRGQEQRLREYILHRGGECDDLESVIALPPGVFASAGISSALLVIGNSQHSQTRLVDLGITKRTVTNVEDTILAGRSLAMGTVLDKTRACLVSRDVIGENDYNLTPSRYLIKKVDVGPNAVPLGELCQLIRPPALNKDEAGEPAAEAGIPDLSISWSQLLGPFTKLVNVRPSARDATSLKPGDILLSVKGTVGKAGLLGEFTDNRVVASQSCVGLRVHEGKGGGSVSAEYLLMYLRSEQGQSQLDALKVGATIQSVGITALMDSFRVPVLALEAQQSVVNDYGKLCELEEQISDIKNRIGEISRAHWAL